MGPVRLLPLPFWLPSRSLSPIFLSFLTLVEFVSESLREKEALLPFLPGLSSESFLKRVGPEVLIMSESASLRFSS